MNNDMKAKKTTGKIRNEEMEYSSLKSENSSLESKNSAKSKQIRKNKAVITGLAIATAVLGLSTIGFGIGFAIADSKAMSYRTDLENTYNSNFYSLVDSVNNLETKISKVLASDSSTFQRKTLLEASQNASEAEVAVASLPLSQKDIQDTVKLTNQISGYTTTLADQLASGGTISQDNYDTLEQVQQSVQGLKNQLNEFSRKLESGYSIIDASMDIDAESNEFSRALTSLKDNNIEYPTMIYDGPFSDSVTNTAVKGLTGEKISKAEARTNLEKYFKSSADISFESETNGKFQTYNFRVTNSHDEMLYAQVTKIGGNILTISGAGADGTATIDEQAAKQIAVDFASQNGIENATVVWSDTIKNDIYLNIAPKSNGLVLYPDLVKVKINMVTGTIVGYDATSYFTNHTDRSLSKGGLTVDDVKGKVPERFEIVSSRKVLSPLDYNREVVCIEIEALDNESTYYFYFNAQTGDVENVLKVIKTDNGNLLM